MQGCRVGVAEGLGRGGAGWGWLRGWGVGDRGFEGGELMRLNNFNEGAHRRVWKEGTKQGVVPTLKVLKVGWGLGEDGRSGWGD